MMLIPADMLINFYWFEASLHHMSDGRWKAGERGNEERESGQVGNTIFLPGDVFLKASSKN
jgi:hypothetical protein